MDPITGSLITGVASEGLGLLGSIIGNFLAQGDVDAANALLKKMEAEYNIPAPELKQLIAEQAGPSQAAKAVGDPAGKQAQMSALRRLQGISEAGGMDAMALADYQRAVNAANAQAASTRGAVENSMASRGLAGSGLEFSLKGQADQAAAQRNSQAGLDANAAAQMRALQALQASGQLGGQVRGQGFDEQFRTGQAADALDMFNTQIRQGTNQFNVATQDKNFQNQMQVANAKNGVRSMQVQSHLDNAQATRGNAQAIGKAGGAGIGFGYYASQNQPQQQPQAAKEQTVPAGFYDTEAWKHTGATPKPEWLADGTSPDNYGKKPRHY